MRVVSLPSLFIVYRLAPAKPPPPALETNKVSSLSHEKLLTDDPGVVPERTFGCIVFKSVTTNTLSTFIASLSVSSFSSISQTLSLSETMAAIKLPDGDKLVLAPCP